MAGNHTEERQCFKWTNNIAMVEIICAFLFPNKKVQKEELENCVRIIVKSGREIIQFDCDKEKESLLCVYIGNPQKQDPKTDAIINGCRELELRPREGDHFKRRAIITADGHNDINGVLPLVIITENLKFHITI